MYINVSVTTCRNISNNNNMWEMIAVNRVLTIIMIIHTLILDDYLGIIYNTAGI